MKKIKGIEIDEIEELDFNLYKIRKELRVKTSFWSFYDAAIHSYEKENNITKAGKFFKAILFVSLIPKLITILYFSKKVEELIEDAEIELIHYYEQPKSKIRRFRLKCQYEKKMYEKEIKIIKNELTQHYKNLELISIGSQTKNEIKELIKAFEEKKKKKENKYSFYQECEKRLIGIEEQIQVRQSIEKSRLKLEEMRERKVEKSKQKEIEKEFELYRYYGNLLDSISINMKKLELDTDEKIEELELKEMINKIELKN